MTGFVVHGHVWGYSFDVNKHRRIIHADAGYSVVRGGAERERGVAPRLDWREGAGTSDSEQQVLMAFEGWRSHARWNAACRSGCP